MAGMTIRMPMQAEHGRRVGLEPGPMRLLIVEDEMLIALGIEMIVQHIGHSVCAIAPTGPVAVAEAERHRPDLVLMDLHLGDGGSGLDAAAEIRRRFDIPALFISANITPQIQQAAQNLAPAGFLSKPFSPDLLEAALAGAAAGLAPPPARLWSGVPRRTEA
jgi:CheY-like chemotaxis protein